MGISRFEDIQAWQAARELCKIIYQLTEEEKFYRDFGLRDQARRAAVSVMANIAEGFGSHSKLITNPKHRIPNLELRTLNLERQTPNLEPPTSNLEPGTSNVEPLFTVGGQPSAVNTEDQPEDETGNFGCYRCG